MSCTSAIRSLIFCTGWLGVALDEVGAGTEMGGWVGGEVEWGGREYGGRREWGEGGRGVLKVGESGKIGKEVSADII